MGFPISSDVRLNFSRYPPGAVNSPVRTFAGRYRETRRRDPKICRNNNVSVDPFARRRRDGKTAIGTETGLQRVSSGGRSVSCRRTAAVVLITLSNRKTRESISTGPRTGEEWLLLLQRAYSMKKTQKVLLFMKRLGGVRFYNVVGSGN